MNNYDLCNLSLAEAEQRALEDRANGLYTLIGGLVVHPDGRLFAQRRSMTRNFGPGLWDNVGGHVEGQETLQETLTREIREETGWALEKIMNVIAIRHWQNDRGPSREYIVLCTVKGDLSQPTLEIGKVDRYAWFDQSNLNSLNENRPDDISQVDIYGHALRLRHG